MSEPVYEYRFRIGTSGKLSTPWQTQPITAEELAACRVGPGASVVAERREIIYGDPEEFTP